MGGYTTTYNYVTRFAIPSARRKVGMMVRNASNDSTFVLSGGIGYIVGGYADTVLSK